MTQEQKMEIVKGMSNEELLSQYASLQDGCRIFDEKALESSKLIRAEILRRMQ